MVDTLEPPPRLTGVPTADTIALREWCWALYNNFILSGGIVTPTTGVALAHGNIYIGNAAGVATAQPVTGDVSISDTGVVTLPTVNADVGAFGDPTHVVAFTVNAKGQITAAADVAISFPAGTLSLTHNFIYVGDASNVAAGVALSGDATIDDAGVITLSADSVNTNEIINFAVTTGKIADDNVTFAKIQNITDVRLLGRSAGSAGDMMEITVGSGLSLAAGALTATGTGGAGDVNPFSDSGVGTITKPAAADFTIADDTTVNHGTGSIIDLSSRGVEFINTFGAVATTQSLFYKAAVSSTLVSEIAYVAPNFGGQNGSNQHFYGLAVRDNTGKIDSFGLAFDAGVGNTVWKHLTFTNISTAPTVAAFNGGHMACGRPIWLKLEKISTNFVFSVSFNGETYDVIATVSATGFIGSTINDVGIILYNGMNNGSKIIRLSCFSFAHS